LPPKQISFTVNGKNREVQVKPYDTLNRVLREYLELTGTKRGCDYGGCGSCTVIVDSKAIYSCMYPAVKAAGKEILTIEGLERDGNLHPIQSAFAENNAFQCGYCTPGFIMSAYALLAKKPRPTKKEIVDAVSGNLCRCGTYPNILKAIQKSSA